MISYMQAMDFYSYKNLPNLESNIEGVEKMEYDGIPLKVGYLLTPISETTEKCAERKAPPKYDWFAREIPECQEDNKQLCEDLINSLKHRAKKGIHRVCTTLHDCLDLHSIVCKMTGTRSTKAKPYDEVALARHGRQSFRSRM